MKENQGLVAEEEEGGITDRDDQRQEGTEAGGVVFPELRNKKTQDIELNLNYGYLPVHVYFEIKEKYHMIHTYSRSIFWGITWWRSG